MASILGMGNPLLDISADVPMTVLEKYGVTLNNAILCEEKHLPVYAELVKDHDVQYIAGGATQNSIRVAQWMSQKEGSTAFVGCVGKDDFGEQLEKSASSDGVAVHYAVDEKEATGTCACLISAKERSLIANLAAANKYPLEHMKTEKVAAVLTAAKFVYAAGFFITVSPPTIMHAAEHCQKEGKTFIMNLSAPFITEFFNEPLVAAIAYTDILFGNESEAASFAKKMVWEEVTSEAIALKIHGMKKTEDKKHVVCITQGADATIVVDKEGVVHKFDVPALKADDIVDSNGAGDAFVGGYLAGLLNGKDIAACVHAGHYAASVVLGTSGTVLTGTPTHKFD